MGWLATVRESGIELLSRSASLAATPLALPAMLRGLFDERLDPTSAVSRICSAIGERDRRFLALTRRAVFARPRSTYAQLFARAQCAFADLEALVAGSGLEAALAQLAAAGVRLSEEEFKGRVPVERDGKLIKARHVPQSVASLAVGLSVHSSGSTGAPLPCVLPLAWIAREAEAVAVFLRAHSLEDCSHAVVAPVLPGTGDVRFLLYLAKSGIAAARWFAPEMSVQGKGVALYNALIVRQLIAASRSRGVAIPAPEPLPADGVEPVLHWIAGELARGRRCCLRATVSTAVRISLAAAERGTKLDGTTFVASAEPVTAARSATIRASGASVAPLYGCVPLGLLGLGCGTPEALDDMHLARHLVAAIAAPEDRASDRPTLLWTTLDPTSAQLQINVGNGDRARLREGGCDCALGDAGLSLHVSEVGSETKLTAAGGSYSVGWIVDILELELPRRFGGGPGDYQLLEQERPGGRTVLSLRVHPRLGPIDGDALLRGFLDMLSRGARQHRFVVSTWEQDGMVRVEREPPLLGARGKLRSVRTLGSADR